MSDSPKLDYGTNPPKRERPFWQWVIIALILFGVLMLVVDSIPYFAR